MKAIFRNRIIKISIAVFLVICITVPVFYLISEQQRIKEEIKITNDINSLKLVKYKAETAYADLQMLQALASKNYSDSFLGFLYERMSFIYRSKGDNMYYYTSVGKALYYLEKSKNFQTMLNLYADLIDYQYIPNGNYDLAEQVLQKIEDIELNEGIKEPRMQTTIYPIKGDLAYYEKNYELAAQMYETSEQIIEDKGKRLLAFFLPITLIHKARNLIELGEYEEAQSLLEELVKNKEKYNSTDYSFKDVVNKLMVIPLYQAQCCIYAHNAEYAKLKVCIEKLIDHAYRQSFEGMALATLQKLNREYTLPPELENSIHIKIETLYSVIYLKDSRSYAALCNSQINSAIFLLEEKEFVKAERRSTVIMLCSFVFVCIVFAFVAYKIKQKSYIDELTGIYNRRYLTKKLALNEKRHIQYSVLMLDIDDFKIINDTYGHDAGDIVLQTIGEILNYRCREKTIEAFRYGGEEFALLIYEDELLSPVAVAENIRHEIVAQKWHFNKTVTVSIGVADKTTTEKDMSIIKQADIFLYYAKKHGKNQVCSGIEKA